MRHVRSAALERTTTVMSWKVVSYATSFVSVPSDLREYVSDMNN